MNGLSLKEKIIGWMLVLCIILSNVLPLYWAFWPFEPLKIYYLEMVEFENGSHFIYKMRYDKLMPLPADVSKQFIDGFIITLPSTVANIDIGEKVTTHTVQIPKLPAGKYFFKWSGTYKVNPIREVTVTARTPYFEVD